MGTPAYVRLQLDSTGKKVQTFENLIGGDIVEAQGIVIVDQNGVPVPSSGADTGAANLVIGRGNASTSAATLAIARPTRRSILIRNLDGNITIYVGPATVTSANGFPLLAGESSPFTWTGLIQIIAASGTPAYALADEYD